MSDFSARHSLMAEVSRTYTFSGKLDDPANTAFQDQSVTLTFEDECRTTTINSMAITMERQEWRIDRTDSKVFTPFTDTTEAAKSIGVCGEKLVVLDVDTPTFLTLTPGEWSYPNNADFTINFN